jgi:hypothetical protein
VKRIVETAVPFAVTPTVTTPLSGRCGRTPVAHAAVHTRSGARKPIARVPVRTTVTSYGS